MAATDCVEVQTGDDPVGSVIWLHGLGADGHDFEPIVPELRLPGDLPLRFVFPHAPVRPVTINGGMAMRAWYDILSLDRDAPSDEAGIRDSAGILEGLIEAELGRGIDADRIVVAGFSQGGAIALHTALRQRRRLAGLMAQVQRSGGTKNMSGDEMDDFLEARAASVEASMGNTVGFASMNCLVEALP